MPHTLVFSQMRQCVSQALMALCSAILNVKFGCRHVPMARETEVGQYELRLVYLLVSVKQMLTAALSVERI